MDSTPEGSQNGFNRARSSAIKLSRKSHTLALSYSLLLTPLLLTYFFSCRTPREKNFGLREPTRPGLGQMLFSTDVPAS